MHRIGRAGRYGGNGASFTILTSQYEVIKFQQLVKAGNLHVKQLDINQKFPLDLYENAEFHNKSKEFNAALTVLVEMVYIILIFYF